MEKIAIPRQGNLLRAEWRQKCRKALSDHLYTKLGLVVEPTQVRLKPTAEDKYTWVPQPGKEHLFNKQLSKHSIRAYMELCQDVDETFEAVALPLVATEHSNETTQNTRASSCTTFTSTIRQLQEENDVLVNDLSHLKEETRAGSAARLLAEERVEQLQLNMCAAQSRSENLRQANKKLSLQVRRLTKRLARFNRNVEKVSMVLRRTSLATNQIKHRDSTSNFRRQESAKEQDSQVSI